LSGAGACVRRELQDALPEHRVRERHSCNCTEALSNGIASQLATGHGAAQSRDERDGRIEMRTGKRAERLNQGDEARARRDAVRQERDRHVPASEALAHDPGPHDGRQEERGADRLRREAAARRDFVHGACSGSFRSRPGGRGHLEERPAAPARS
jgi:hypothetical protein